MKKLWIVLLIVQMLGTMSIYAQENIQTSAYQGVQIVDELKPDEFYHLNVIDISQVNSDGEHLVFEKSDLILTESELSKLAHLISSSSVLYLDLGDGQYVINIENIELDGQQLTMKASEVLPYSIYFHEGLVTESGQVFPDPSDAVITSVTSQTTDLSQWIAPTNVATTDKLMMLTVEGQSYWASVPYKVGENGAVYDDETVIMIGAYSLSSAYYGLHINLVPAAESVELAESSQQTTLQQSDTITETTTTTSEETTGYTTTSSVEFSTTVMTSQAVAAPETTQSSANNLPSTGEKKGFYTVLGSVVLCIGYWIKKEKVVI